MIRKSLLLTIVGVSLLASGPAWSKGFKYSFADFLFNYTDGGDEFADAASFSAKGSFAVHDFVHLVAGLERGEIDDPNGGTIDATGFEVGIGGNYDFNKKFSGYLDALWFDNKLNSDDVTLDEGGYKGEAGIRYQVNKPVELNLYYVYEGGDVDTSFGGGRLLLKMTKKSKFHIGVLTDENTELIEVSAGVRLNF